jgi:hypothetical protein
MTVTVKQVTRVIICQLCRKRVYQQRDGAWYHRGHGSVHCNPGYGDGRKAVPVEIEGKG